MREFTDQELIRREKALYLVDFFLTNKVPSVFLNMKLTMNHINQITERLGLDPIAVEEEYIVLEQVCRDALNKIKDQLENLELTEEELLTTDVISSSYSMLEKISNKLDEMSTKLLEKSKNIIVEEIDKKEDYKKRREEKEKQEQERIEQQDKIKKEINELEKQKMFLKGKLEFAIFSKKDLAKQILEIEAKIEEKNIELSAFHLDENDDSEQREDSENIKINSELNTENNGSNAKKENNKEDELIEF